MSRRAGGFWPQPHSPQPTTNDAQRVHNANCITHRRFGTLGTGHAQPQEAASSTKRMRTASSRGVVEVAIRGQQGKRLETPLRERVKSAAAADREAKCREVIILRALFTRGVVPSSFSSARDSPAVCLSPSMPLAPRPGGASVCAPIPIPHIPHG